MSSGLDEQALRARLLQARLLEARMRLKLLESRKRSVGKSSPEKSPPEANEGNGEKSMSSIHSSHSSLQQSLKEVKGLQHKRQFSKKQKREEPVEKRFRIGAGRLSSPQPTPNRLMSSPMTPHHAPPHEVGGNRRDYMAHLGVPLVSSVSPGGYHSAPSSQSLYVDHRRPQHSRVPSHPVPYFDSDKGIGDWRGDRECHSKRKRMESKEGGKSRNRGRSPIPKSRETFLDPTSSSLPSRPSSCSQSSSSSPSKPKLSQVQLDFPGISLIAALTELECRIDVWRRKRRSSPSPPPTPAPPHRTIMKVANMVSKESLESDLNYLELCRDIEAELRVYGNLEEFFVQRDDGDQDAGNVFARFSTVDELHRAINALRERTFEGRELSVHTVESIPRH